MSAEDAAVLRRWIAVIATTPSVVASVLGGVQLKGQPVIAAFLADRLGLLRDDLVPTMLAAAAGGVLQASLTKWFVLDGDVTTMISEGLKVLERGIGSDTRSWSNASGRPPLAG